MRNQPELENKRRSERKTPNNHIDYAVVSSVNEYRKAIPLMIGLIVNESKNGCCIVGRADAPLLDAGKKLLIKVGNADPTPFRIIWMKPVDDELVKCGCEYLC